PTIQVGSARQNRPFVPGGWVSRGEWLLAKGSFGLPRPEQERRPPCPTCLSTPVWLLLRPPRHLATGQCAADGPAARVPVLKSSPKRRGAAYVCAPVLRSVPCPIR